MKTEEIELERTVTLGGKLFIPSFLIDSISERENRKIAQTIGITIDQFNQFIQFRDSFPLEYWGDPNPLDDNRKWSDFMMGINISDHIAGILVLKHEKPAPQDILYVASGYGIGPKLFELLGYNVQGIDTNSAYLRDSIDRGINAVQMDATQIDFPENSFDVTISRNLLREDYLEFETIVKALKEQYKVLKKGGIAVHYTQYNNELGLEASLGRMEVMRTPFSKHKKYKLRLKNSKTSEIRTRYVDVLEK